MHFFYPICINFESSCFKVGGNNSIGRHPRLNSKNITTKILVVYFVFPFPEQEFFLMITQVLLHKNYLSFAIHIGTQNNCLVRIDCQNSGANNSNFVGIIVVYFKCHFLTFSYITKSTIKDLVNYIIHYYIFPILIYNHSL